MVKRLLVTTALEETWGHDEPILFLGEWCRFYSRKPVWEKLDAVVAPYHWDDREKLHKDYLYLQGLHEELLIELVVKLNTIHGVNHSVRYWRIIVGPWLGTFIQMLFDRWAMLQQVVQDNDISGVRVVQRKEEQVIPNDMTHFTALFTGQSWNEAIYGQILAWMKIPVEIIAAQKSLSLAIASEKTQTLNPLRRLKRLLVKGVIQISSVLSRDNDYFFMSTYLSITNDLYLQVKLGQIPKIWRAVAVPTVRVDLTMRQWELATPDNSADFLSLARSLISKHIPATYLEGYQDVVALTENLPWPKNPKAIFTSNSYSSDDMFKVWAAEKTECGSPLVIGQHGGHFGMDLWSFTEDHQIAISDRFLTWGWSEPTQDKITPVGNFKGFSKKGVADKAGNALLVQTTMPLMSYHIYCVPVAAGQLLSYFEDQCSFVEALPLALRDQVLVRLQPGGGFHSEKQRWEEHFQALQLDEGRQPIMGLMSKARLCISTCNSTTLLESMALNLPTIIFFNPKHWELRDSAIPYFEQLKAVGIFHETPESAARQMVMVWDDVADWWGSAVVQSVRREFCKRYVHSPDRLLDIMEKLFRDVATTTYAKS
jgi:putative transferase (TIGR04331 family)